MHSPQPRLRVRNNLLQGNGLVREPAVAVPVRDNEPAFREGGADHCRQMGSMVGNEEGSLSAECSVLFPLPSIPSSVINIPVPSVSSPAGLCHGVMLLR